MNSPDLQTTISGILDKVAPIGTQYIVYVADDPLPASYGPWDSYGKAHDWMVRNAAPGIVVPLYPPSVK